jgi:hypothetical protein
MATAGDNTVQRQNVASSAVQLVTQIVDAIYELQKLHDQRSKFVNPFVDSDFTTTGPSNINQLTAAMIGTFFDFVYPSLNTNFLDAGNGGRNQQIMLQMRGG